jgi:hypothetical protein
LNVGIRLQWAAFYARSRRLQTEECGPARPPGRGPRISGRQYSDKDIVESSATAPFGVSGGIVTFRSIAVAAWLALVGPAIAQAADGILITQQVTSGGSPIKTQMQIEPTRMRTDVSDPNGMAQTVIFDATKQVLYVVDAGRKTYMEMTKADAERMAAQMQGAMAQMQAQLEKLPPAQRAQMEGLMKGRGMAAPAPKIQYTRTGSDKAGRWACDKYDMTQDGQKIGEICTVAPTALGFALSDFDVTRQLAQFFSAMMPQMASQVPSIGSTDQGGYAGFPVKSVVTLGGRTVTSEVVEANRQTFADSLFTVPAGFAKQDMMGGRGGRP